MTSKLTRLTDDELAETLRLATSGYPLSASTEANLRHAVTELQERRKADSEPVAWTWQYREQWHVTNDPRRAEFVAKDGDVAVLPLYRHAQPAPVVADVPFDGHSPYDTPYKMPSNFRELIAEEIGILFSDDDAQGVWSVCRAAMLQAGDTVSGNSFSDLDLEGMSHGNNPQANAYRELLAYRRNSPVIPEGWKVEAEKLAEMHGMSFVLFRHGEAPQCADPTKVVISFTDKGLGHDTLPAAPQEAK